MSSTYSMLEDGTVLALGLHFRSATDKFDALDSLFVRLPDDHPEKLATAQYAQRADARRQKLFEAVFQRRAESLADAAVLPAHGLHRVEQMLAADQVDMVASGMLSDFVGQLTHALANIVTVTIRAAGLEVCQIGYPSLGRSLRELTAPRVAGMSTATEPREPNQDVPVSDEDDLLQLIERATRAWLRLGPPWVKDEEDAA